MGGGTAKHVDVAAARGRDLLLRHDDLAAGCVPGAGQRVRQDAGRSHDPRGAQAPAREVGRVADDGQGGLGGPGRRLDSDGPSRGLVEDDLCVGLVEHVGSLFFGCFFFICFGGAGKDGGKIRKKEKSEFLLCSLVFFFSSFSLFSLSLSEENKKANKKN